MRAVLVSSSAVLAFCAGMFLWAFVDRILRERAMRDAVLEGVPDPGMPLSRIGRNSLEQMVVERMQSNTKRLAMGQIRAWSPKLLIRASETSFEKASRLSGVRSTVSVAGFCDTEIRFACFGVVAGVLLGAVFSIQLSLLLALAGAIIGFILPGRALKTRAAQRAYEVERHLPEMLDVIALGMRSGMSFDSSLVLYGRHFDTMLAKEMLNSRIQWSSGLVLREEALRTLASTYDSVILSRTFETVIRSIRYGTSMVESLEDDAREARDSYQAAKEEMVAKAPVKMMVPTGVLILPAMLMLVLGPVLLELMGGSL